jgi:tRNA 2-thiouridine synthesizing protein A
MSETLLDVKGMNCPLPVLRANRALRGMAPGQRLRVLATDRAAVADFQAFCQETGHALLAWSEESGIFSFVIRRRTEDRRSTDAIRDEAARDAANPAAPSRRDRDRKDG